jgi:hypothetical protein
MAKTIMDWKFSTEHFCDEVDYQGSHQPVPRNFIGYRDLPKYSGDPKSADIAFCVFSLAQGISESELAADLENNDFPRNPRLAQAVYV